MLGKKEKAILQVFLENKENFITSKAIAEKLKVSDRTIRNYIKVLDSTLLQNGSEIISKQGNGYKLKINYQKKFDIFLRKNIDSNFLKRKELQLDESKDRQYYILNKLLFEEAYVLFDDLSEELFISRSTLSHDFSEIRKILRSYDLLVNSKANKGVYIQGDERNKRHFIINYFFGENFITSINKYIGNALFFNDISFEELTIIVLDECRAANLKLSDYIIQNLVLHIALEIKRIKDGFQLSVVEVNKEIDCKKELGVAKRILKRVSLANYIKFPEEETYYIALHLMVKSMANKDDLNSNNKEKNLLNEINDVLINIEYDTGYPMSNDQQLINGLITHFNPFLMRLKHKVCLSNPLLGEIRNKYSIYLELTKKYLKNMPILKEYKVSDSEWAYISLHFMAAIERYKDKEKLKVLLVCATGYGSAQMLKTRIKKEFRQHISVIDVVGYYDINDKILKEVDLIISSIDLSTVIFNIPVIHTSVFLNDKDINKIKKIIEKKLCSSYGNNDFNNNPLLTITQKKILIQKFFNEDCFTIIKKSTTKKQVIEELTRLLQRYEPDNYFKIMIEQINQREYLSSVVFSDEIAVPHPAKLVGEDSRVAVAIIPDGIKWSEEFTNIKFIFLLSPSKFDNEGLNKITQAIVELIDNELIKEQLLKCKDFNDFKSKFIKLF